jgi:predicted nuclease with RNAse H fold
VRTLGIDLAASEARTAACFIDWSDDAGVVRTPHLGLSDDRLLEEMTLADKVAIDAPFGWPEGFVEAVNSYANGGPWPAVERSSLRYRETDRVIAGEARALDPPDQPDHQGQHFCYVRLFAMPDMAEWGYTNASNLKAKQPLG